MGATLWAGDGCEATSADTAPAPAFDGTRPQWFAHDYDCADEATLYFRKPSQTPLLAQHFREYETSPGERFWTVDASVSLVYGGSGNFSVDCDSAAGQVGGRLVIATEEE